MAQERLDKLISLNCNVSRREARQLIKDHAVTVDGSFDLRAESIIDTDCARITVNGHSFDLREHIYIMLNKPSGVITATEDRTKQTVIDIIPDNLRRKCLFPCGRLDRDTTGLLIITDDGDFAHRMMSPSHKVYKTYIATLSRELGAKDIRRLESGIGLEDGTHCLPARVEKINCENGYAAKIQIREGKYHQVKRMFAACGNNVEHLRRVQIGALKLDESLAEGECRELTADETEKIFSDE